MKTQHQVLFQDARSLKAIADQSVQLVITSPPYPMVAMWDDAFSSMSSAAQTALQQQNGSLAFEAMHQELDKVWSECFRVLQDGGFACINIGDATRTLNGRFQLYPNHARIISAAQQLGFSVLPDIIWRKPTNAPNKFMGSGMLPAGAYVTYEHEYILIFRKGKKRIFSTPEERQNRRLSAYFWEERNRWFSDIWSDIKGSRQRLSDPKARNRSAAFPVELAYRLICMYSVYGDRILDPFVGTGSSLIAAAVAARNSIGIEIQEAMLPTIKEHLKQTPIYSHQLLSNRLLQHQQFVSVRSATKPFKYTNKPHTVPVITQQETALTLLPLLSFQELSTDCWESTYENH